MKFTRQNQTSQAEKHRVDPPANWLEVWNKRKKSGTVAIWQVYARDNGGHLYSECSEKNMSYIWTTILWFVMSDPHIHFDIKLKQVNYDFNEIGEFET